MRVKLKSSKSFPNDLVNQEQQQPNKPSTVPNDVNGKNIIGHPDEDNNSSSGVSSDQEPTITHTIVAPIESHPAPPKEIVSIVKTNPTTVISQQQAPKQPESILKKPIAMPPLSNVTKQITSTINIQGPRLVNGVLDQRGGGDDDIDAQTDSPSPPSKGFQRHNSLTRKQAASIAMNRAIQSRNSMKLPPTIEDDSDCELHPVPPPMHHHSQQQLRQQPITHTYIDQKPHYGRTVTTINTASNTIHSQSQQLSAPQRARNTNNSVVVVVPPPVFDNKCPNGDASPSQETILLAPPPQFCDCTNANITRILNNNNAAALMAENNSMLTASAPSSNRSVRIVGAVPKMTRMHQWNEAYGAPMHMAAATATTNFGATVTTKKPMRRPEPAGIDV